MYLLVKGPLSAGIRNIASSLLGFRLVQGRFKVVRRVQGESNFLRIGAPKPVTPFMSTAPRLFGLAPVPEYRLQLDFKVSPS